MLNCGWMFWRAIRIELNWQNLLLLGVLVYEFHFTRERMRYLIGYLKPQSIFIWIRRCFVKLMEHQLCFLLSFVFEFDFKIITWVDFDVCHSVITAKFDSFEVLHFNTDITGELYLKVCNFLWVQLFSIFLPLCRDRNFDMPWHLLRIGPNVL